MDGDTDPITAFDPAALPSTLPEDAHRYLTHAVPVGAPLATRAMIDFSGQVRLRPNGSWTSFEATETLHAGRSFRVTAHARRGPFTVRIEDVYADGRASSRVRLLGVLPIRSQRDADLACSSRGRLAVESTWLPTAFHPSRGTTWAESDEGPTANMPIDGVNVSATFHCGPNGELLELQLPRWSDLTPDGTYGWVPFSARVEAERTFDGYTIPSEIRAGRCAGTDHAYEFFRATVRRAEFW